MKLPRLLAWSWLLLAWVTPWTASGEMTRAEFANAIATLKEGMSAEQVIAALGKPDDIRSADQIGVYPDVPDTKLWAYGSADEFSFPTLGCVYMTKGRVEEIYGRERKQPDPWLIGEQELRDALKQIGKPNFGALYYIQTVNCLQPLGKDKALAAIDEYLRVASRFRERDNGTNILLLLRLLFELPPDAKYESYLPDGYQSGCPTRPEDIAMLPLYPFILLEDVPFVAFSAGPAISAALSGPPPEQWPKQLAFFKEFGKMRGQPLRPANDPLPLLNRLVQSPQWSYGRKNLKFNPEIDGYEKSGLAHNLLVLVNSVYRAQPVRLHIWFDQIVVAFDQSHWDQIVNEFATRHAHWDAARNDYVFPDGTSLSPLSNPFYEIDFYCRCELKKSLQWSTPAFGEQTCLFIDRKDSRHLSAIMMGTERHPRPAAVLKIRLAKSKKKIAEIRIPASKGKDIPEDAPEYGIDLPDIEFPEGEEVQAVLTCHGKTTVSPGFTP